MQWKGRPKSKNIEDRRKDPPYNGPIAITGIQMKKKDPPEMSWGSKVEAHYRTSIRDASQNKRSGQRFKKD